MSKLLPASGFKWIDPKEFDLIENTSNNLKGCENVAPSIK